MRTEKILECSSEDVLSLDKWRDVLRLMCIVTVLPGHSEQGQPRSSRTLSPTIGRLSTTANRSVLIQYKTATLVASPRQCSSRSRAMGMLRVSGHRSFTMEYSSIRTTLLKSTSRTSFRLICHPIFTQSCNNSDVDTKKGNCYKIWPSVPDNIVVVL